MTCCTDHKIFLGRKYKISIQSKSQTRGGTGAMEDIWSEHVNISATVDWKSGNETVLKEKNTAITRVYFGIRYNSTLTKEMRISYDSKIFEIKTILEVGNKKFMQLRTELVE